MGLVTETPSRPQKPRIFSPVSQPPERGGELKMERIINRACVTKPPEQEAEGSERSRVAEHPEELGWRCLRARGRSARSPDARPSASLPFGCPSASSGRSSSKRRSQEPFFAVAARSSSARSGLLWLREQGLPSGCGSSAGGAHAQRWGTPA